MPIPTGAAAISFSQLRTEMNTGSAGAYTGAFSLNDVTFRLRLTDTSQNASLSLSAIRGNAYQRLTIAANTTNYDIRTALVAAGWNGTAKGSANVVINANIVVGTPSNTTYAMDTGGPWPAPSTIAVYNSGYVVGQGGAGGAGAPTPLGTTGHAGGPALRAQRAMTLVNSGTVGGGGGGGGGGAGNSGTTPLATYRAGGGGGGGGRTGNTISLGGAKGNVTGPGNLKDGVLGANGTFAGAGAGGDPPATGTGGFPGYAGGAGGNWGTAGTPGLPTSPTLRLGGAAGISVQGWSMVTAPTGSTGISGPTTAG